MWLAPLLLASAAAELLIDSAGGDQPFYGIGGLSGGGATSRLLVDYREPQRSEILDLLFKPRHGASLQLLKVEIGGDAQSTDGTEPSHMHSPDDLDVNRGYEWWLLKEAKKRNPEIKTYALPWAFPGWLGAPEQPGTPFQHPERTSSYILRWLEGARNVHGVEIDYVGVWNERSSDATYVKTLRKTLDKGGFANTTIVAKDGESDICVELAGDEEYIEAVGVIGLHYPSDYKDYSSCRKLGYGIKGGRPIWASEESGSYDDFNGAACWARVIASHYVLQGFTSSIMWNLVAAYYHGTNWYGASMLTAVEPWSGHYEALAVVWATAHVTQFTKVGWSLLEVGSGSGQLPQGGFYTTYSEGEGRNWTLVLTKISHDHAACTRPPLPGFVVEPENATFRLARGMKAGELAVWYSHFEETDSAGRPLHMFERLANIHVEDGIFHLNVPVGSVYTVSTILEGPAKGPHPPVPPSQPSFPLPYYDDFEQCSESQEGRFWSDQAGSFEVHSDTSGNKVMRQMVPELPIGWRPATVGPMTVLGMREWQDITVAASIRLPTSPDPAASACLGSRADQLWANGIALCIAASGAWALGLGVPRPGGAPHADFATGNVSPLPLGTFSRLTLTTVGDRAWGSLEAPLGAPRKKLFEAVRVRDLDTGFAALGASGWFAAAFDNVSVEAAGQGWVPSSPCKEAAAGEALGLRRCARNGLSEEDQVFELLSNWAMRHVPSGLCASAADADLEEGASVPVLLASCNAADPRQQFRNVYTRIRNDDEEIRVGSGLLRGYARNSSVFVERRPGGAGSFQTWSYFPNTKQLRNQFVANPKLGYPLCLSTCSLSEELVAFV